MSEIFSKTAKGQDEVKTRAGGLTQRMRQILIFIDGKRSRDDLHDMLKGEDLDELLHTLVAQGMVAATGTAPDKSAPPKPAAAPATAPKAVTKAPEQSELSEEERRKLQREQEREAELAMARSFMGKMS